MRLLRVQVPEFRVLKDVDITFEPDFTPAVFPLGSQNGGGKSTLLQLIFTLLHCPYNPKRENFLKNILNGLEAEEHSRLLAKIHILDGKNEVVLEFLISEFDSPEHQKHENVKFILLLDFSYTTLRCKYSGISTTIKDFFREMSNQVFLAAPVTQIFQFISRESQKLLFKQNSHGQDYHLILEDAKVNLPGLFTYDFFATNLLIQACKLARNQDFAMKVESGQYGDHYQNLVNNLNLVLGNKKINISPDLSEITFKLPSSSGDIELFPEDLSHGELKRLSLYVWLKLNTIEDAIVLMDEVELALHPDWQYQIVKDLVEWAPSNQYILATHSYELCQAVTPAHVKELPPRLVKADSQQ